MKKRTSIENEDDYIDPDAMIEQIDREIEHHRRAEENRSGEAVNPSENVEG